MDAGIEPRSELSRAVVLALVVLALALGVVMAWPHVPTLLDRLSPARVAARAISRSLLARAETVGPVEISGSQLRLLDGTLRLTVARPKGEAVGEPMGHFHVTATIAGVDAAPLDACLLGTGDTPEKRLESVAETFVGIAFPPLFSRAKGEPMLGARSFWGHEAWGVRGRSGYVGPVLGRGSADGRPFLEASLFSDIPDLPQDGRAHLLKAVLYTKNGYWLRTVELDGNATAVSGKRYAPLAPNATPGAIVRFAFFGMPASPETTAGRNHTFERLKVREDWLFGEGGCPADIIPATLPAFSSSLEACRGGRLLDCMAECRRGAASFCWMAAYEVQAAGVDPEAAQALYLRSCRLGFASGCTNAAAGRLTPGVPMDRCSVRTFDEICERAGDPWACAMLGSALARGDAAPRDPDRARTVLAKACRADETDPACQAAKAILGELEASASP